MLSRANIICCILSILLVGYLVVSLITSSSMSMAATAPAKLPVKISVAGEDSTSFVTRREIAVIVKDYFTGNTITPSAIPTLDIENTLNSIDNIENARCTRRSNDRLWIEVTTVITVELVVDIQGSYYI